MQVNAMIISLHQDSSHSLEPERSPTP